MRKTVIVTGACINTGVAIVEKFAAEGYDVVFTGRDLKKVSAAEEQYRKNFPAVRIMGFVLDSLNAMGMADTDGVEKFFAELDKLGIYVEALVLNAADQGLGLKIFESDPKSFNRVLQTNMVWNYCLAEQAALRMRGNGGGSITFVNSNTAKRAIPDRIAYCASKSGQLGMMRALALDLGKYGIRVNAVLPGMIRTDRWTTNPDFYANVPSRFTPIGDVADGADIADAVYYFVAHARNTTGTELIVDGGNCAQLYPIVPNQ
ncbi:MAG: SDR family oxidoreductase [Oscillospiraceae bacterium]|nr:SDR family oxidoreductase [Oscillospiraceae bacterium]